MGFRFLAGFGLALLSGVTITATPLSAQDREVPYWAALRYEQVEPRVLRLGEDERRVRGEPGARHAPGVRGEDARVGGAEQGASPLFA